MGAFPFDHRDDVFNDLENQISHEFSLMRAFPNPFNDRLNIHFAGATSGMVNLNIFDPVGRSIFSQQIAVVGGVINAIELNADDWAAGVYLVRLAVGSEVSAIKVICLK
jgi:hypothetical protein